MTFEIGKDFPNPALFLGEAPCISLYQQTHRHYPDNKQDIITYKNLIQETERLLHQKYAMADTGEIMKPFYELKAQRGFWEKALDGLAVLASKERCIVYVLTKPVTSRVIVSDCYHIAPLIREFQSTDRYHLLALSGSEFSLYEGNRFEIKKIELNDSVAKTIEDVLGEKHSDHFLNERLAGAATIIHGHGGKKETADKDLEKFFRYVDGFILENYSKLEKIPLILASLEEHHSVFKRVSDNPYLLDGGIKASSASLEPDQLKKSADDVLASYYLDKVKSLAEGFHDAKANNTGADDLAEIAKAVFENKVRTMIVEVDKIVPGKYDDATGAIKFGDIEQPGNGNILDDLVKKVFMDKGKVIVLPKEKMPVETGVAAIFRY